MRVRLTAVSQTGNEYRGLGDLAGGGVDDLAARPVDESPFAKLVALAHRGRPGGSLPPLAVMPTEPGIPADRHAGMVVALGLIPEQRQRDVLLGRLVADLGPIRYWTLARALRGGRIELSLELAVVEYLREWPDQP